MGMSIYNPVARPPVLHCPRACRPCPLYRYAPSIYGIYGLYGGMSKIIYGMSQPYFINIPDICLVKE